MAAMGADNDKIGRPTLCLINDRITYVLRQGFKDNEFCVDVDACLMGCLSASRQHFLARLAHCKSKVGNWIRHLGYYVCWGRIKDVNEAKRRFHLLLTQSE